MAMLITPVTAVPRVGRSGLSHAGSAITRPESLGQWRGETPWPSQPLMLSLGQVCRVLAVFIPQTWPAIVGKHTVVTVVASRAWSE